MPNMVLHTKENGAFAHFAGKEVIHLSNESTIIVGALSKGMTSGAPSIAFGFDIGDNKAVLAETSLALFLAVADALKVRFNIE